MRSTLERALSVAALCGAVLLAAGACGPLSAPLPRRLPPERQQDVDEAWDRALTPVTKYDRATWLDVLIVRQPYEFGVDKFQFKSEKRFAGGVVEMEARFDRAKPDEDLFQVTVKDAEGVSCDRSATRARRLRTRARASRTTSG